MSTSLYERLGGTEGISKIASDAIDNHLANPRIQSRYVHLDHLEALRKGAANFFIAATGGPDLYEGRNMLETHQGMNIDDAEFMAALDDILNALNASGIAQREQEEVLFALYSMRQEIVHV